MASLDPVYCPKCKLGFAPVTIFCPSCDIELVPQDELGSFDEIIEPDLDVSSLHLVRTERVDWIQYLLEKLAEAEIGFRVVPHSQSGQVSVYVSQQDRETAGRIDHEVYKIEVQGADEVRYAKDLPFDSCPACGAKLEKTEKECRACGLVMLGRGWRCTNCEGELEGDEDTCPYCGEDINWDET